ncbi:MAG: non-histone chromosomal MC1 family protein [Halobacteriaceae archaeon]
MVREDGKRNFALRDPEGNETSVFSGNTPRQAALKAARRLDNVASSEEEAKDHAEEIRLREKGTDKVHKYEAWAWEEEAPSDAPEWMPPEITEANVSKKGIEHLDEI